MDIHRAPSGILHPVSLNLLSHTNHTKPKKNFHHFSFEDNTLDYNCLIKFVSLKTVMKTVMVEIHGRLINNMNFTHKNIFV